MIDRRDLLIGGGCAAALAVAEWRRPRAVLKLMPAGKLDAKLPRRFGDWSAEGAGDIVVPKTPGSLADRLYSQTVARTYIDAASGAAVMLVAAYGEGQSDLLQLHRPESCYPAVGFVISHRAPVSVAAAGGAVPAVALTAESGARVEDVVYWTRLGEYLPRTAGEQRSDRLKTAMAGNVADGVLVRASSVRQSATARFDLLQAFLRDLIGATDAATRRGLVGTGLSGQG